MLRFNRIDRQETWQRLEAAGHHLGGGPGQEEVLFQAGVPRADDHHRLCARRAVRGDDGRREEVHVDLQGGEAGGHDPGDAGHKRRKGLCLLEVLDSK